MRPFDLARYQQWRATFPWSDEEFARAAESLLPEQSNKYTRDNFLHIADRCRRGRIDLKIIRQLLPVLTHCACGRIALYRVGVLGFCAAHKGIATRSRVEISRWLDTFSAERERQDTAADRLSRNHIVYHRVKGKRRGRK